MEQIMKKVIEWQAGNGSKISLAVFEYLNAAIVDART
jgi:hypothetical protein